MRQGLHLLSLTLASMLAGAAEAAPYMIVGNDEKLVWDDQGKPVLSAPGRDSVLILDLADPEAPTIVANLPIMNSVIGPPTNLAITPDQTIALVANSLDWVADGESWKFQPDNKIYVIDLKASPPAQIGVVEVGKQPSGMAINKAGTLALVANRAENSVNSVQR